MPVLPSTTRTWRSPAQPSRPLAHPRITVDKYFHPRAEQLLPRPGHGPIIGCRQHLRLAGFRADSKLNELVSGHGRIVTGTSARSASPTIPFHENIMYTKSRL